MAQEEKNNRAELWVLGGIFVLSPLSFIAARVLDAADQLRAVAVALTVCLLALLCGIGLTCWLVVRCLQSIRLNSQANVDNMRRLLSGQTQTEAVLTNINENLLLSDAIKSIAFRRNDRTVLEEAIQEDMRTEQWASAHRLIQELEERFGYKDEAQKLREELSRCQNATRQEIVDVAIQHLKSLWVIHHYKDAVQQEEALLKLHPDNPDVRNLQGQTEQKRQAHKKALLEQLDKASQGKDLDRGVEILKLLDNYLTPTEAAALEESARDVFRARLHKMGVQFSMFVTEKAWDKAFKLGKEIINEYPNSRMAQEVREKMEILEQNAR
jgi:hypothetical protein